MKTLIALLLLVPSLALADEDIRLQVERSPMEILFEEQARVATGAYDIPTGNYWADYGRDISRSYQQKALERKIENYEYKRELRERMFDSYEKGAK